MELPLAKRKVGSFHRLAYGIPVRRVPANTSGRDFIVGDIHGHLAELWRQLTAQGFSASDGDRLFSVGDLIDRGPDSIGVLRLLREPWFYAVRGNHEIMMIEALRDDMLVSLWEKNGGDWWRDAEPDELMELAAKAARCPLLILVGDQDIRFGVIHAELPIGVNIDASVWSEDQVATATWSRKLHSEALAMEQTGTSMDEVEGHPAGGIPLVYCGHTSVPKVQRWKRHVLIDTGMGWFENGKLTVVRHGE